MKENKVLSVIFGIALLAVLISAIGLLFSSVELLGYTALYNQKSSTYYYTRQEYYDFQKPIAISLFIAAIFAIVGVVGGTGYIFSKKRVFKIIFLSCIVIAVIATLASLISVCSIWNTYADKNCITEDGVILLTSEIDATCYALYTTTMSSIIQNLVCVVVVSALTVYDFVKPIIENKRSSKSDNSSAEELRDINVSEKE